MRLMLNRTMARLRTTCLFLLHLRSRNWSAATTTPSKIFKIHNATTPRNFPHLSFLPGSITKPGHHIQTCHPMHQFVIGGHTILLNTPSNLFLP